MARTAKRIQQSEIQGLKYFSMLDELLTKLKHVGTQRDKAGNRELFCDQYLSLLLLYFFSPVITSMRALQEASELEKVQKVLGVKRVSLGSFCEAPTVFDPKPVHDIIREIAPALFRLRGCAPTSENYSGGVLGTRSAQGDARTRPALCDRSRVSRLLAVPSHPRRQVVVHRAGQRQHRVCGQRGTCRHRRRASGGSHSRRNSLATGQQPSQGGSSESWAVGT